MPNRIIKESAFTSDRIAVLSDFEFRLWIGLITQADDVGRGDARPAIIKGRVFALRDRVTIKDIDSALHALAAAGCVSLYKVGGKPYYEFPSWAAHQRIRDAKTKYPGPDEADDPQEDMTLRGNSPQLAANCGLNPIQSESNPNPNPNPTRAGANGGGNDFDLFWDAYPKKVGKADAQKAFAKIRGVDVQVMIAAIETQKRSRQWQKDDGQYIPNPSTWLNQGRWQDETTPVLTGKGARGEFGEAELAAIAQLMEEQA